VSHVGLTAHELIAGYRALTFSPVEVIDATEEAIARLNPVLGAFTTVCSERARREAQQAERRYVRREDVPPLLGVPFAAKDLFDTEGVVTTYGSAMFAQHVPGEDAVAVRAVRRAGGILVGKTQTHEFAWGLTSVNHAMGSTRNPWSLERISGGSSGGSAVAVAAGLVPLALGTDTAGSVRVPSALCGVVGLKPTYGRVSLEGVFPLAPSLDHAGQMARTPADAALLLAQLSRHVPLAFRDQPARPIRGLRVGLPAGRGDEHDAIMRDAGHALAGLGARLVPVTTPDDAARVLLPRLQAAEALFAHTRAGLYPARSREYGDDIRRRLEGAGELDLEDYLAAQDERERLRLAMCGALDEVDVLLGVAAPPAPRLADLPAGDADFRHDVLGRTSLASLCGLPACVVRAGFDGNQLPLAVQITGAWGDEATVLSVADHLYAATADVQAAMPGVGAMVAERATPAVG
jgi:aspartyl-tRNA(Asn)/glutamyl-tRNA(Gln) amidotransferase subunit A